MEVNADLGTDLSSDAARDLPQARAVQADIGAFLASTRTVLAEMLGPDAVTAEFGHDGVLSDLRIDGEARKQLTEDQLLAQLDAALAASPAVGFARDAHAVSARVDALIASASAMLDGSAAGAAPEPLARDELSTPDGALTLLSIDGRPVGLRTRPGWILSEPSAQLGGTIVRLARQAAVAAEDGRGTV